jgi:molybdate transport system substrate-binding protein
MIKSLGCLTAFLLITGCGNPNEGTVFVLTDPSTRDGLDQVSRDLIQQTGIDMIECPGSSAELLRKIERGDGGDILITPDEPLVEQLEAEGLVGERRPWLTNRLVVVVPASDSDPFGKLADLTKPRYRRIALGGSAGKYARQALTSGGIWDRIQSRILQGADSQTILGAVGAEEVDAGLVYKTDAGYYAAARVALTIPAELHDPIRYSLILIKRTRIKNSARTCFEYLDSEETKATFLNIGLTDDNPATNTAHSE